jgi:hypothetical protein
MTAELSLQLPNTLDLGGKELAVFRINGKEEIILEDQELPL